MPMPCGWRWKRRGPRRRRATTCPLLLFWPPTSVVKFLRPPHSAQGGKAMRKCVPVWQLLSGRRYQVMTAVALFDAGRTSAHPAGADTGFLPPPGRRHDRQLPRKPRRHWQGGRLCHSVGRAEIFVKEISGSYSNVVGLPLALTVLLLKGCGLSCSMISRCHGLSLYMFGALPVSAEILIIGVGRNPHRLSLPWGGLEELRASESAPSAAKKVPAIATVTSARCRSGAAVQRRIAKHAGGLRRYRA